MPINVIRINQRVEVKRNYFLPVFCFNQPELKGFSIWPSILFPFRPFRRKISKSINLRAQVCVWEAFSFWGNRETIYYKPWINNSSWEFDKLQKEEEILKAVYGDLNKQRRTFSTRILFGHELTNSRGISVLMHKLLRAVLFYRAVIK